MCSPKFGHDMFHLTQAVSLSGSGKLDGIQSLGLIVISSIIHGSIELLSSVETMTQKKLQVVLLLTVILHQRAHWAIENPLSSLVTD